MIFDCGARGYKGTKAPYCSGGAGYYKCWEVFRKAGYASVKPGDTIRGCPNEPFGHLAAVTRDTWKPKFGDKVRYKDQEPFELYSYCHQYFVDHPTEYWDNGWRPAEVAEPMNHEYGFKGYTPPAPTKSSCEHNLKPSRSVVGKQWCSKCGETV